MLVFVWGFVILVYVIFIYVYVSNEVRSVDKVHSGSGGFWGLPYVTWKYRDATRRDVVMGLLWPVLFVIWFAKTTIWCFNDALHMPLLLFGFSYKDTRISKWIKRVFN